MLTELHQLNLLGTVHSSIDAYHRQLMAIGQAAANECANTSPPAPGKLPISVLHLLAAKHGFSLLRGEDFASLMTFARDVESEVKARQ